MDASLGGNRSSRGKTTPADMVKRSQVIGSLTHRMGNVKSFIIGEGSSSGDACNFGVSK